MGERGFTNNNGSFTHSKRGVYGTGFETTFTIDLPGFGKAEKTELEKAANELFLDIANEEEPADQAGHQGGPVWPLLVKHQPRTQPLFMRGLLRPMSKIILNAGLTGQLVFFAFWQYST